MNVRCEKCRTKFHYEKCMGVCPKCSRYMSPKQMDNAYDPGNYSGGEIPRPVAEKVESRAEKKVEKKKINGQYLLSAVIVCAMIAAFIYTQQKITKDTKAIRAESNRAPSETVMEVQAEGFHMKKDFVKVEEGEEYIFEGIKEVEGFKYLSFPYYMEEKNDNYHDNNVFLKIDEMYISPMDSYNLTDDEEKREALYNGDLRTYFSGGSGYLVFAVPEAAHTYEMYVQEVISNKEDDKKREVINHLFTVQAKEGGNE